MWVWSMNIIMIFIGCKHVMGVARVRVWLVFEVAHSAKWSDGRRKLFIVT